MYVQKIHPKARLPVVQHDNSYLVYASEDVKIPARGDAIVTTGLYVAAPPNHTIRAASGSESFSHSLEVSEFCSANYPNPHRVNTDPKPVELSLKVYNHGKTEHVIKMGSQIGRILVTPSYAFEVLETDVAEVMRRPPKAVDRLEKKISAPKTAIAWFKKMYVDDYDYVKTHFLSDKVVKEVDEYKLTPNYLTNPNKENLEAVWAWSHLDETIKERIRREMIIRNEQEERVSQMSGTDMSKVKDGKPGGKKAAAKKAAKKAVKDDDEDTEDNEVREKAEGDPDETAPENGEREPVERIEDIDEEEEPVAQVEDEEEPEENGDEDEGGADNDEGGADNDDEEPAPVAKPAARVVEEPDEDEEEPAPVAKPAAPKAAAKPAARVVEGPDDDEDEPAPVAKPAAPKAAAKPVAKVAAKPAPVPKAGAKPRGHVAPAPEPVPEPEPVQAPPVRQKAAARPGKKPAARV